MLKIISGYFRKTDAATMTEYGLIAAGISLVLMLVMFAFGDAMQETMTLLEAKMAEANANL